MMTIAIATIATVTALVVYCMLSVQAKTPSHEPPAESPETLRSLRAKYARFWPEETASTTQPGSN